MSRYEQSRILYERAQKVLAGGVSSEFRKYTSPHPLFYSRGEGACIWDVDGNRYLDFTLSQGPLILGHSPAEVLQRVASSSQTGQLFAGQYLEELELAERLTRLIPCAELSRFSLSGSEAVHAALRVSRAITGRPKFLRFEGHYHGWFDNVAVSINAPQLEALGPREQPHPVLWTKGLPPDIASQSAVLPWNDLGLVESFLKKHSAEIAAIITEPVMCNNGCIPPEPGFLAGLRRLADRFGCVLIFDEVITGFRLDLGGAQQHFEVTPDLAVFGKALANGYPISVLTGQRKFMQPIAEGTVIHAGTMNSGQPSIAAALATLDVLEREPIHARLFQLGTQLMQGLRDAAAETGHQLLVQGMGPMFHMGFTRWPQVKDLRDSFSYDKGLYAKFVAGMQERNIRLIGRGLWYISAAHTEQHVTECLSAARAVLETLPR